MNIKEAKEQIDFIGKDAESYPTGYAMFLISLTEQIKPPVKVIVVPDENFNKEELLQCVTPDTIVLLKECDEQYSLKNGKTTYYVCTDKSCLPPQNELKI